jgi:argininosuccinate lyase
VADPLARRGRRVTESRALGADSRLSRGPAVSLALAAFADELRSAPYIAPWLGVADMAHVAMMLRAGVVEPEVGTRVLRGLYAIDQEGVEIPLDPAVGDVYNNRDAFLRERLGADAGIVHTGRARREATTVAWQLACRERIVAAGVALAGALEALVAVAEDHRSTVMPDYTYLQAAQPTTLGHYLLGFAYAFLRDHDRLLSAYELVNRSPAGSGSVNGSRFAFEREWVAQLMGFDSVVTHARDAMWAPDMATEQLSALVTIVTNIDRLVEDLQIWATTEFGYVELDDGHTRTSVIMPHKKNPYSLAWMRGRARFLIGRWVGVVTTFLTPTGQPDNRITAYVEVPAALDDAAICLDLLGDVFRSVRFDVARMAAAANTGYLYSSDLCDLFVERAGIDNRSAHRIVGYAVRERIAAGGGPLELADVTRAAAMLDITLPAIDEAEFDRTLQAEHLVALRRSTGGAAPEPMQTMLDALGARTAQVRAHWTGHPVRQFRGQFLEDIRTTMENSTHE